MRAVSKKNSFWIFWFGPMWLLLGFSRAVILLIPFRHLSGMLGDRFDPWPHVPLVTAEEGRRARDISHVVQSASRYTPWKSNCYTSAIAARLLLGLYGIPYIVFLGLRKDDETEKYSAHAWVVSGPVRVVGGSGFGLYAPVGCFGKYGRALLFANR